MSNLIILQCTGTKVSGGNSSPLQDTFALPLAVTRNQLCLDHNQDLNQKPLMPAYERYGAFKQGRKGGLLYTNMDWQSALRKVQQGSLHILIASALYGLVEFDTPIADYDLTMAESGRQWLQGNTLGKALQQYLADRPNIQTVKTFLSNHYFKALGQFNTGIATHLGNTWIPYDRGANVARTLINPFIKSL